MVTGRKYPPRGPSAPEEPQSTGHSLPTSAAPLAEGISDGACEAPRTPLDLGGIGLRLIKGRCV